MDTLDTEVLKAACEWVSSGHRVHLFTVIQTWGSAPRPVGALLAIRDDGRVKGSVSGGCIEDDLIQRVRQAEFKPPAASHLHYGVSTEEARRFGLPCGGRLELVAESLCSQNSGWLHELAHRVSEGQLIRRTLELSTGAVTLTQITQPENLRCTDRQLVSIHGPQWRLFIVGAGQISDYLAPMAQAVGFAVSVCDPRAEYADTWNVPGTYLLHGMPDDELQQFRPDTRTAIVTLTHDPKLDDLALIDALPSAAFYVGALGSVRHQAARKERLMTHFGLTENHFARLHGPVGLYIGSRTPPEIAVSVMAQIIAEKYRSSASNDQSAPTSEYRPETGSLRTSSSGKTGSPLTSSSGKTGSLLTSSNGQQSETRALQISSSDQRSDSIHQRGVSGEQSPAAVCTTGK